MKIMDKDMKRVLFEKSIGKPGKEWGKVYCETPAFDGDSLVNLLICFTGTGNLDLDEVSLMPSGNINGIRKDQYELYKEWSPTIMRYPGGWFVEYSGYKWQMSIGDIDKRSIYKYYENVRMDFGIDEFLFFCESLNIEPHITVSFLNSTPEESAALVEYCNGPENSHYGSLRAKNGRPKPYNVKFWEIGNEIWENPVAYANGFVDFYDKMKAADPSISCIISADIWQWKPFFDTLMTIIGNKCDIYGWHWTQPHKNLEPATSDEVYLAAVGGSHYTEFSIDSVDKWIIEFGLKSNLSQAITEIWSTYNPEIYEWGFDTVSRAGSLENGLWMASQIMSTMKKADKIKILEKTIAVTTYRTIVDYLSGIRESYKTPSYLACQMSTNHYGTELLPTKVNSNQYSTKFIKGLFNFKDINYLDIVTTSSKDSMFIFALNRHPYDTNVVYFSFSDNKSKINTRIYELSSNNYLDENTQKNPNKISIKERVSIIKDSYNLLPHSFSILSIAKNQIDNIENPVNDFNIFATPNPFDNYTVIRIPDDKNFLKAEIFDNLGRIYTDMKYNIIDNNCIFYTQDLGNGIYYLALYFVDQKVIIPIIKNKNR